MDEKQTFGAFLTEKRLRSDYTLRALAAELGVSPALLEPATSRAPMRPLEMKIYAKEGEDDE